VTVTAPIAPTFGDLGLPPKLVSSLAARGLDTPVPIQAATIPDALDGRDICGRAPTGSGKTIAFGIPLVLGVGEARPHHPRGLVLVPTRELAAQVSRELQLLGKPKGPWVESFYGGVGFDRQLTALRRGVDIAVACPGRLADLVNQRHVNLSEVDFVVIDEADRMADMGFLPEVRRLLDQCRSNRQTLLFSATLDGDVDVLISKYQHDPARHEFRDENEGGIKADHLFWAVERPEKLRLTAEIVARTGATVVFCRTKRGADRVARQLDQAGVRSAAIHGNRSQSQRDRALQSFHDGRVDALVATDVAARGIHVDDVACVIHFDPPEDDKAYVHRSGRTARAGSSGVVVSLVPGELRRDVGKIQRALDHPVGLAPVDLAHLGEPAPPRPRREAPREESTARRHNSGRPNRANRSRRGPKAKNGGGKNRSYAKTGSSQKSRSQKRSGNAAPNRGQSKARGQSKSGSSARAGRGQR
jgi:superfamily II DNA/RNA helicase